MSLQRRTRAEALRKTLAPAAHVAIGFLLTASLSRAHAQLDPVRERVVLIAPGIDARAEAELVRGLDEVGVRAVSVADAKLDAALAACQLLACAADAARASQGRVALARLGNAADGAALLLLALVSPDGSSAQAQMRAGTGTGELARAMVSLWNEASMALVLHGDSLLRLQTVPAGASVWVDAVQRGTTPFAARIAPGEHRVVVKLGGFIAQERLVRTAPGRASLVQMRLARAPDFAAGLRASHSVGAGSPWNYILGGTLVLAALPALVSAINTLANDGQCLAVDEGGECRTRARYGGRTAFTLAFGVLAFGGGAAIIAAQPFESERPGDAPALAAAPATPAY